MRNWLKRLIQPAPPKSGDEERLELERQAQALRLELAETKARLQTLQTELERQRQRTAARSEEQAQAQIERLLSNLARPAAQFITQVYLAQEQCKELRAHDVLAVAQNLLAALRDYGLVQEGEIGQILPFDPDRHEALSAEGLPATGQLVNIRFAGLSYHGKLLRKAGVTPAERAEA